MFGAGNNDYYFLNMFLCCWLIMKEADSLHTRATLSLVFLEFDLNVFDLGLVSTPQNDQVLFFARPLSGT